MMGSRTEARWFFAMTGFLIFYCIYLFVFRGILIGVENKYQINIFKPEPVQVFIMGLLIVLYHFCFVGLYFFSKLSQWQKTVAAVTGFLVTGSLLVGFREWYLLTSEPFFQFGMVGTLPWYAREKTKFLITNTPLILFLLTVFVFRVLMIFQKESTPDY